MTDSQMTPQELHAELSALRQENASLREALAHHASSALASSVCAPAPRNEMERVFENALIGLAITDPLRLLRINPRGADLFGATPDRLVNVPASLLFHDKKDFRNLFIAASKALRQHGRFSTEARFSRMDGHSAWLRLYAKAMDPADIKRGILWAFDDIGPQRELEEALRRSKEEAEKANQAKIAFLANMSHELRTPINGITGMLQLAQESNPSPEIAEFLSMSMQSATTLMHIVNDLLELSTIERGRLLLAPREFDPRAEFEPLLRNFSAQSRLKHFTFHYAIDPGAPERLIGDPDRTRQILVNLLGNAFKFTRKGKVSVSIGPAPEIIDETAPPPVRPGTIRLFFTVRDTGTGIKKSKQADIFEPFGIGEDYLTKKYSGAGMGLSICKLLTRLMRGAIWFTSEPDRGSVFSFYLDYELPAQIQAVAQTPQPDVQNPGERSLSILLAEDEPVNRIFTVRALKKLGHTVETANDGRHALTLLEKQSFDLILMDIQMPRLNGLEATKLIRAGQAKGAQPDIPIVALTAYAMESDKVKGQEAGMDEYVSKPFEIADLVQAMDKALRCRA